MKSEGTAGDIMAGMIVTIDGPAGSGKSTTAKELSARMGLVYLDTGAMYRAVTWKVLRAGIDPEDEPAATRIAEEIDLELLSSDSSTTLRMDGELVGSEIRGPEVSAAVSPVSRHPGVRSAMVRLQRRIGAGGGIVAEGRDTGSTVFPFAHVKIYLIAGMECRAARRKMQLEQIGMDLSMEEIRRNISERDEIDSLRECSPLTRPVGAFDVDTTNISIEEQVGVIENIVRREAERLSGLRVPRDRDNPFKKARSAYYSISQAVIRFFARFLFGLRIFGSENLRFSESFFFSSNHISWFDPPLVGSTLEREIWFVAKKELFRNPIFSRLIKKYHAIPIDREGFDRSTIKAIDRALRGGGSVLMFPEGTRSTSGRIMDFKPGIGMIAYRSARTIVPTHIRGSNVLRACLLRKERLEVRIGKAIRIPEEYESIDRKNDYAVLSRMIRESMKTLEDEAYA
jgi:cytidylate kinase